MLHPKVQAWEAKLKQVFDRIDDELEARFGAKYPLHPARPARGATADREQDGLFNVGAAFSAGYGSAHGPGYVVEVRLATLARVPAAVEQKIERHVADRLRVLLPEAFPGRTLYVDPDGPVWKIHGDLALGSAG